MHSYDMQLDSTSIPTVHLVTIATTVRLNVVFLI